jgi:DNA-binding NarL/FixJ family response regulator
MTIYEGITITLVIIGLILIVWSFFIGDNEKNPNNINELEDYEEFKSRVEDINQKILDLNEYSEFAKSELDSKHRELLFLYQLINEKQKEIAQNGAESINKNIFINDKVNDNKKIQDYKKSVKSTDAELIAGELDSENHNKRIIELSEQGYSISEIAKLLDIGQGQVKLVLNLYR